MKPRALVQQSRHRAIWRSTTDRPDEIREALAARGITEVFKGDQNQAWDAVLANHCLMRAVGDAADTRFFVQDEKLGTADRLLARLWRRGPRAYALTEDYYRGRKGAVWEHQDVSYGLFFTEAVAPEQFAAAAVHLPRAAALWAEWGEALAGDPGFMAAMAALGTPLDPRAADSGTRLGPAVNAAELAAVFAQDPEAGFYYALTRTTGLYGIVPVRNDDATLSSIPANDPELRALGRELLVRYAARGAMRCCPNRRARAAVKERARELARWAAGYLGDHPRASVADFQAVLGQRLTQEIFPEDRITLTRTSEFMRLEPDTCDRLCEPDETLFYVLDLALRHPQAFAEAYNEALNEMGFGLQRVKFDPRARSYHPPFFVEFAPGGPGTPAYRFALRLEGAGFDRVVLENATAGTVQLEAPGGIHGVQDLCRCLSAGLADQRPIAVVGKAAPFAAELRRWPRALGLPRQGSKYTPMVDLLMAGLRERGVLASDQGLVIRVGLNALDRLARAVPSRLRLPGFLASALGTTETGAAEFAGAWRAVAGEAHAALQLLEGAEFGQHVHLVKVLSLNSRGASLPDAAAGDPRLQVLVNHLAADADHYATLCRLGRDVPASVAGFLDARLGKRAELLAARREQRDSTPADVTAGLRRIDAELLFLYAAYVRRLWQRAESLAYVNDRPYSLALYLLFGPEYFRILCREVEFDLERAARPDPVPCGGGRGEA